MLSTSSLLAKLQNDFSHFQFISGSEFRWAPQENTVYYPIDTHDSASLLHELSHAVLDHQTYTRDIQLLDCEQAAWQYAKTVLAMRYGIEISQDAIEDSLDTYRDWLHARSSCPECRATGMQIKQSMYSCLACRSKWHVNDARTCQLQRTIIT